MRLRFFSVVGCTLLSGASPMGGHEVQLGVDQTIGGESNVFMSLEDPIAAGLYTLSPRIRAKGKLGGFVNGEYRASYTPSYRVYVVDPGVDAFDNSVEAGVSLDLARQDRLTATASYLEVDSIQGLSETNPDGSFDILAENVGGVTRAFGGVGYTRSLSRRSQFSLQGNFQDYGYDSSGNVGNKSVGFTASYTSARSPRLTLGGSLTARHRIFDDVFVERDNDPTPLKIEGSRVTVTNLNVLGSYRVSPTLTFKFEGGPSLIRTSPGRIADRPKAAPDDDLTYFATMSLVRDFKKSKLRLGYERSEDPSAGLNRTSVSDTVSLRLSHRLREEWDLSGSAGWSRRRAVDTLQVRDPSTGDLVPISQQSQLDRAWAVAEARRRLWKELRLSLTLRYQRWIDYSIAGVKQPEQDNFSGMLQFRYSFDPYVF